MKKENKTEFFQFRITPSKKKELKLTAAKQGISVAKLIEKKL